MIVPGLTTTEAEIYIKTRLETDSPRRPTVHEVGFGDRRDFDAVRTTINNAMSELLSNYKDRSGDEAGAEFDGSAAVLLHKILNLNDRLIAEDDFWRYLACLELFDVVMWRYPRREAQFNLQNFGIGGRWECWPKRLWLRGELSYDSSAEDPYCLTVRGGVDFWVSGILRKLYSCSRPIARALVRFQFPVAGGFQGDSYRPQRLTLDGIRELYKRLRHFDSTLAFSSLTEADAADLLESFAGDLPRQRGSA